MLILHTAEGVLFFLSCFFLCLFGHCHTQSQANIYVYLKMCAYMFVFLWGYTVATKVAQALEDWFIEIGALTFFFWVAAICRCWKRRRCWAYGLVWEYSNGYELPRKDTAIPASRHLADVLFNSIYLFNVWMLFDQPGYSKKVATHP